MKGKWFLSFIAACFMLLWSDSEGKSHSKQVRYYVTVLKLSCWRYHVCTLHWLICWRWEWVRDCYYYYEDEARYRTVCLDGWSGGGCDIPICKSCMPGYDCVAPDKCECRSSGGSCNSVPCSTQKSCFPGTCVSGSCRCPTLFSGDDCQKIELAPSIESCEISIESDKMILSKAACSYEGLEPAEVVVNSVDWKAVVMTMEAKSAGNLQMPSSVGLGHIKFPVKLGVASSKFEIYKNDILLTAKTCDVSANEAKEYYKCFQKENANSLDLKHGNKIIVKGLASHGGSKEGSRLSGNDNSFFDKVTFTGIETWRKVIFKIDLMPPVHCYTEGCNYFPIQLDSDVTSEAELRPTFAGWNDEDSGIKMIQVKVFLMTLSSDDLFETVGKPFLDRTLRPNDPDFHNFIFNCKRPGVHSIEIIVYDGANNTAKARNIFIYTGPSKLSTNSDFPIRLSNGKLNKNTGEYWITDEAFHVGAKQLTISWSGYFFSDARFADEWLSGVRPWDGEGIDDVENTHTNVSIGMRTVQKMKELKNGIVNYSLAYYVDRTGGGLAENYTDVKVLSSTEFEHSIDLGTSTLGTTVGILLTAIDVAGGKKEEKIKVRIDTTAPKLFNFSLIPNDPDIYTSNVSILLNDLESGIDAIHYELLQILDGTNAVPIKSDKAEILTRSAPEIKPPNISKRNIFEGPCQPGDTDCYCTSYRSCFSVVQYIVIDHCWIDRQVKAKNKIAIDFEALNQAGLSTGKKRIVLSNLEELHCRPAFKLTTAQLFGVVVCVLVGLIILSATLALIVRIYIFKKPPPVMMVLAYSNFRDRMHRHSMGPMTNVNELYISGDNDIRGIKPQSKSSAACNQKEMAMLEDQTSSINFISDDDVQVNEPINKGSALIISKGSFNDGTNKIPVAVKYLKNGASQKVITSANAKAECLATLPCHDNIVKVFGLMKSNNGHMIVMEYCEMSLKSWLMKISDVNPDVLDDMLSFALNISRGVEHLHTNEIIHKRLAIRNVLLVQQFNQFVAKLIGFGSRSDDDEKASVPIKWLAPETLSTISKKCPTYTEKSDAWSYGITLWEMYTLGKQQPYPDFRSNDAKSKIISGKVMECPDECPPDVYEKVMLPCWAIDPKKRPTFCEISGRVDSIKKGEEGQAGYYSAGQDCPKKSSNQSLNQTYYTDAS